MSDPIRSAWEEHQAVARAMGPQLLANIEAAAEAIRAALAGGGQVLIFGNGGSAADAQHFAAELVGRYVLKRRALPAVALTTDTSALTAIGNDYGFEEIFARQVAALARRGDVAVGISTSGNSANVIRGLAAARQIGAATVALTGGDGGKIKAEAQQVLIVPSSVTARIQEMHILIIHMICDCVDRWAVDG